MPGEYLPPVIAEFQADIAAFLAKLEEAKLALRSFKDEAGRGTIMRVTMDDNAARTEGRRLESDMAATGDRIGRRMGDGMSNGIRDGLRRTSRDAQLAADLASDSFIRRFRANMAGATGGGFGGGFFGMGAAGFGAAAIGGAPLIAGAAFPVVGAAVTGASAVGGSLPMLMLLKDAYGEVTKAAGTLESQTNTYNAAAARTATFLATDTQAASSYQQLLGQLTPTQAGSLQLLTQQDVQWQNLTLTQQAGLIQLRDTQAIYKALSSSQQISLNALIAEQKAWSNLVPQQQQAVVNYQAMHDQYDALRQAAMPAMFGMIASAEQAATDALKPLLPLVNAMADAWKLMFDKIDQGLKGSGYQKFIDTLTTAGPQAFTGLTTALGNIGLGFVHIWEALQPMAPVFLDWLDRATAGFAKWATTPRGITDIQHFMSVLEQNGPGTWQILTKLAETVGTFFAIFAGDQAILQIMNVFATWLLDIMRNPVGRFAVEMLSFGIAIERVASALKLLAIAQALYAAAGGASALRGLGGAAAGGVAARAAGGAAGGAAGAAGGAAAGGAASAGGGAASALFNAIPIQAKIVAAGVIIGGAILAYAGNIQQKSDQAKGIIQNADGTVGAATTVAGTKVSQAFQNLANSFGGSGSGSASGAGAAASAILKAGGSIQQANQAYADFIKNGNAKVVDVMNLGKTQFGQSTALFVAAFGGDVGGLATTIKASGKTLDQAWAQQIDTFFTQASLHSTASWASYYKATGQAQDMTFQKIEANTKTDYTNLQSAWDQLQSDAKNHRKDLEAKDMAAVQSAWDKIQQDATTGQIDTQNKNIKSLETDFTKFFQDMKNGDTVAMQQDLAKLGSDVSQSWKNDTDLMSKLAQATTTKDIQAITNTWITQQAHLTQSVLAQLDADIARAQAEVTAAEQKLQPTGGAFPHGHAMGGFISGPGTGTSDSIPAHWLSHGEFVVNARSTAQHRQLLEALNSQGHATGGFVDSVDAGVTMGAGLGAVSALLNMDLGAIGQIAAAQAAAAAAANVPGGSAPANLEAYALSLFASHGWTSAQMPALIALWNRESGWNPNARNASSGAAGIPQDITGNFHGGAAGQIQWGENYIASRYGSPQAAWNHEVAYGWYDTGGKVGRGRTVLDNGTGLPEALLTASQWNSITRLASAGAQSQGAVIENVVNLDGKTIHRSVRQVEWRSQRRNGGTTLLIPGLGAS
jgi:hypothetical protein